MKKQKLYDIYHKSARQGFTIIEMLLVAVVIAILAGVGSGFYTGTYKAMLVKKSARQFLLAAKYASILAIERQSRCRIKFDLSENNYALFIDELNENKERIEPVLVRDIYFKPVEFDSGVTFEGLKIASSDIDTQPDEQSEIIFQSNGSAQTAMIQIGDGENHYTVSISGRIGKVKIQAGTIKDLKADTVDLDEQWY